jgi:hypothetical protein
LMPVQRLSDGAVPESRAVSVSSRRDIPPG